MAQTTLRQRYTKRRAWGLLASIDLAGCDHDLIRSPKDIRRFVTTLIKRIGMQPYGPMHLHQFGEGSLHGYSVMQFIETSSITIHFDDAIGDRAFIDIFSCKMFDPDVAARFARSYFKAKKSRTKVLIRS